MSKQKGQRRRKVEYRDANPPGSRGSVFQFLIMWKIGKIVCFERIKKKGIVYSEVCYSEKNERELRQNLELAGILNRPSETGLQQMINRTAALCKYSGSYLSHLKLTFSLKKGICFQLE